MSSLADTIVASATPPGIGGVAIVRVSGEQVESIADAMLGELPAARVATYARIRNASGDDIDTGLALYFPGPESFTGESVLELHCHGGPVVVSMLVDAVVESGARLAEPGEFTKRAFLNGKLDLAQAEAVADLIASGTSQSARAALRSLSGAFSRDVEALAQQLGRLRLYVEAAIDFPEEEIDFLGDRELRDGLERCAHSFTELQSNTEIGRVLRDGYRVVIVGKPNAGKSSLLNRLSGEEAAIVTEFAGTTRDVLREQINIDGLIVELVDTAGLRDDPDQIEKEGIRRAREALRSADAVLWIQDACEPPADALDEDIPEDAAIIVVRNKVDLSGEPAGADDEAINLSAKTGAGLDALHARLKQTAGYKDLGEGAFSARKRHVDALRRAAAHFNAGSEALEDTRAGELLAEELRLAQEALGEITGAESADDLLGRIFSEFCIGK